MTCREAFVKLIRDENFYSECNQQSLRKHWSGVHAGFADPMVQKRWRDFLAGWNARDNGGHQ